MIKKIRTRFILIVMCATFVVMSGILTILNVVMFENFEREAEYILTVLKENNGELPIIQRPSLDKPSPVYSPEMPFRTRYFTVIKGDEESYTVNITKIASITEEQAIDYTKTVIEQNKRSGFYMDYRIATLSVENGEMYIFLDCSAELKSLNFFLRTTLIIGASAEALVFILVWIFSTVLVQPTVESYNKQKRFITDASHELKTPLTVIGATNEIMEMQYGKSEWTEVIDKQVKKLADLTEKLVLLSKMDEGGSRFIKVDFCISDVAKDMTNSFEAVAQTTNTKFNVDIEDGVQYTGDMTLIGQVMSILLENAFKYSTEDGSVDFSLSTVGKNKKITVSNVSENVSRKKLDKVFDRFYRVDESRNSETGGSGIGLSIAHAIVTQHKGKITVNADEGNRVTFTVLL